MSNEIDVSECKWCSLFRTCDIENGIRCSDLKDCYFQQLQQSKKENEELKHEVKLMMDCPECKVDEYEQALKEIEKIAKYYFRIMCGAGGQSMNLQDKHYGMMVVAKKILEVLKEIK